jgi:hypothetical protein
LGFQIPPIFCISQLARAPSKRILKKIWGFQIPPIFCMCILQVRSQWRISQTGTSEQAANKQPTSSQRFLCILT